MSEIHQHHDKFFKKFFSLPGVSRDFLSNYLPQDIVSLLDLATLELKKDSFIDEDLREHFSDLLCKVRLSNGTEAYIYLLLEHKSYSDRMVSFQSLRYMVRIWERVVRKYEAERERKRKEKKKNAAALSSADHSGCNLSREIRMEYSDGFRVAV